MLIKCLNRMKCFEFPKTNNVIESCEDYRVSANSWFCCWYSRIVRNLLTRLLMTYLVSWRMLGGWERGARRSAEERVSVRCLVAGPVFSGLCLLSSLTVTMPWSVCHYSSWPGPVQPQLLVLCLLRGGAHRGAEQADRFKEVATIRVSSHNVHVYMSWQ